jgi:hypothetical protein
MGGLTRHYPTALLKDIGCKHPMSPAMLAGQRRDYAYENITSYIKKEMV